MRLGQAPSPHSHTPLWDNPTLPELATIPDHDLWVTKGVIYLSQVVANGSVKAFQTLKDNFALSNHMFFRYLQLQHALNTQLGGPIPALEIPLLVDIVLGEDPKKQISQIYTYLMRPIAETTTQQQRSRWESDLGILTDEDWEEALGNCKIVSPKLSDRLSHLYVLHRSYLTPARISKYKHDHNPGCPDCGHHMASFFHLMWDCSSIQGFWTYLNILLQETLFLARLLSARTWLRGTPPTLRNWIRAVNNTLPYKKVLYTHRGCPKKYYKIWDRWLEDTSTCDTRS